MQKILFLVIWVVVITTISCSKKSKTAAEKEDAILSVMKGVPLDESEVYTYVLLVNSQTENPNGTEPLNEISVMGAFQDESGNFVSAGDMSINGRNVPLTGSNGYQFKYTGADLPEGRGLIGNEVDISLSGSAEYPASRRTVYVPANIISGFIWTPYSTIRRNVGYALNWYPDPNSLNGKMYIQVSYYGLYSRIEDRSLPRTISPLVYTVDDNGSFTIPAADLARFPYNGYISIGMARGVQYTATGPTTRKKMHYFTISDFQTSLMKVIP